jgi:hypothetical protein
MGKYGKGQSMTSATIRASWTMSRDKIYVNLEFDQSPHLRTPNPEFIPHFYITNVGDEPRVKLGVWRPEIWALLLFPKYYLNSIKNIKRKNLIFVHLTRAAHM